MVSEKALILGLKFIVMLKTMNQTKQLQRTFGIVGAAVNSSEGFCRECSQFLTLATYRDVCQQHLQLTE